MNNLTDRIRAARKQAGLTQADVAKALRLSVSAVNQWEQGLIKNIKLRHFFALANLLGQDPQWLATGKTFPLTCKPALTAPLSDNPALTNEEKILLHQVRHLDTTSRKLLIKFLRALDGTYSVSERPARRDDRRMGE